MISASEILGLIQKKGVDEAEVFLSSTKALKIDVHDGKVEAIDEIDDTGCGLRVIKGKKLGFAFTSDFAPEVMEETIAQAIANAQSSQADEFNSLPDKLTSRPPVNLDLFDPGIAKTPVKEKIGLALKIEEAAYKTDPRVKKTEKVKYTDSEGEVWIANSRGVDSHYKYNYCGGHADMIAVQNGEMEAGFGLDFVKRLSDFKPEMIGREAGSRAASLLGAGPIPSQRLPLVLDPFVGTQLLEVLALAFSSDAVQKGRSLFAAHKLGNEVGSEVLTIIDDGRLPGGLVSSPFDGEGVPTQETKIIENGILRNLFYNTYTASKGKTRSTGNATRGTFMNPIGIGPTNLYIPAGKQSETELLASIERGFYVQRVMGIHTANPISGDFSIGAAGFLIENGEKTFPVRGITIAGNLIAMLKNVEMAASNLRFITNIGSPTLLISGITIGGG